MKLLKWIVVPLLALGANAAQANDGNFLQALNACLQTGESSLRECAYIAAKRAKQNDVRVVTLLGSDDPRQEMGTRDNVEVCSNDGYDICDIYNCSESNGQSSCDYIGTTCGAYWCN